MSSSTQRRSSSSCHRFGQPWAARTKSEGWTKAARLTSLSVLACLAVACDSETSSVDHDGKEASETSQLPLTCAGACDRDGPAAAVMNTQADGAILAPEGCAGGTAGIPSSASVDVRSHLGRLSNIAVGVNSAAWDSNLLDAEVPALVRAVGAQIVRYPGGSTSDNYHWLSNAPDDPAQGGTDPRIHFDAYMSVVTAARAESMITVNYGSGTPKEAADWVRYANRGGPRYSGPVPTYPGASTMGHNYGIRYWEVGNELYGDGTYGATWEVNHQSHDPATYAEGVVSYSSAMKAVDPSIRVGMVLTAPGNWPDGVSNDVSPQPWNDTVLPIACSSVDFVIVHWYAQGPGGESDAALLLAPQKGESTVVSYTPDIPSMVSTVKSKLAQYCGSHAATLQIMVTETNSVSYNPGKQTTSLVNSLFLADEIMTWFESGVSNVDWWTLHNSPFDGNGDASLYGDYGFGDYGVLSRGLTSTNGAVEPPANTPFPSYYGLQMLSHLGHHAQETVLKTTSSNELVAVHAVRQLNGKVNVMLVNKDRNTAYDVKVSLPGLSVHGLASVFSYGKDTTAIVPSVKPVHGSSVSISVSPYSIVTVKLP
jgi:alpha-L-arabinofuranosidase